MGKLQDELNLLKDNNTQPPVTEQGPKYDNTYYDVIAAGQEKPEYTPSQDTSVGSAAAQGTQYSWDKQGTDQAQNQYQQDVLAAKQDALANRQTIEQNALQYQQEADMMQYSNNQNAEKVGWTGGYVLDQNRQMDYLKASIQAQMYGAMELQKYGYDSALSAARLSYDLNQKQFAHQYYQDAVNAAIAEAQITGTYFSAESRDMLSQYNVAENELGEYKDMTIEELDEKVRTGEVTLTKEQEHALAVKRNIVKWYHDNDVSTTGIKTLAAWETEQALAQQWADAQWQKYQAALASAENKAEDANMFIKLDKEGNPMYDGTSVQMLDFRTMDAKAIADYLANTSQEGKSQVFGYVDGQFEQTIINYITTAETITNADGSKTPKINVSKLKELLENQDRIKELSSLLGGYTYSTKASDSTVEIAVDDAGNISVEVNAAPKQVEEQAKEEAKQDASKTYIDNYEFSSPEIKQAAYTLLETPSNKVYPTTEIMVNDDGDTFTNNWGNRGEDNNFSLLIDGDVYHVQNGKPVRYGSALDVALESLNPTTGAVAVVDGIMYVRDTCCWYTVEKRDNSYGGEWQKICTKYGLDYTQANSPYTTNNGAPGDRNEWNKLMKKTNSVIKK